MGSLTVSLGTYLADCVLLGVIVVALATAAWFVRRALLPQWSGGRARLAEATLAVAIAEVTAEALGTVGEFRRGPYALALLVVTGIAIGATRGRSLDAPDAPPIAPPVSAPALVASGVAVMVVLASWASRILTVLSTGITDVDSNQYHLPFAATFAQTGWLSRLHFAWLDAAWSYYPFGGELVHAIGMVVFRNDALSVLINLGWFVWVLAAAWYLGLPWRAQPLALMATVLVLGTPIIEASSPGAGTVDVAVFALVLTALAVLANGRGTGELVVAGTAAGLAVGTKLNALGVVAAITVGMVFLVDRRSRLRSLVAWVVPASVAGGFWYLRNVARTANPVTEVHVPGLPAHSFPVVARQTAILGVLGRSAFWHAVPGAMIDALGPLWPVLIALAVFGVAFGLLRPASSFHRLLAVAALVNFAVYAASPGGAGEPLFNYENLGVNFRYGDLSLLLGLMLAAWAIAAIRPRLPDAAAGLYLVLLVGTQVPIHGHIAGWPSSHRLSGVVLTALLAAAVLAGAWVARRGLRPALTLASAVIMLVVGGAGGLREVRHYLRHRYAVPGALGSTSVTRWAEGVHDARIAVVAFAEQYPMFGADLSNAVDYVGVRQPHGGFVPARSCTEFLDFLTAGRYGYVVVGVGTWGTETIPEGQWMSDDPAARPIVRDASATVFALGGAASPPCRASEPPVVDLVPGKSAPSTFQAAAQPGQPWRKAQS